MFEARQVLLTDAKMLVPHCMKSNSSFVQMCLEISEIDVQFEFHVIIHVEIIH